MYDIYRYRICINKVREKLKHFHKPGVSIIISTNKAKYINNIYNNFIRSNYKTKEMIIILNGNNMNKRDYDDKFKEFNNVSIFKVDENVTLGECLNFGVSQAKYDYMAKMDDDDYYAPNYLLDSMNVFEYTDAQVTGKATFFVYFEEFNMLALDEVSEENKYSNWIAGGTFLIKKSVFNEVKYRNINLAEDVKFINDCKAKGIRVFSNDKYNYIYMKHKNVKDHTWQVETMDLLENCTKIAYTNGSQSYVTI